MFGYVRIYKPDLKVLEYEQYQGVYCALCRALGKRYGPVARLVLSYDMTFFALLGIAMDDGVCHHFKKARCTCNPFKKCTFCGNNSHIDTAADMTALLMFHKFRDTINDESFFSSIPARLAMLPAKAAYRRASAHMADVAAVADECMAAQAVAERAFSSTDAAAHPFATLIAAVLRHLAHNDNDAAVLDRLGYFLGRWIYLTDAADDFTEDKRKNRFNPFVNSELTDIGSIREQITHSLNATLAECIAAYNLLDIKKFDGILRNILEQGMPQTVKTVTLMNVRKHHE